MGARAGLDGDNAPSAAHQRGAEQRKVARVGAHVDKRVSRHERTQHVRGERGLPGAGEKQALGEDVGLVRAAQLEAAHPNGRARAQCITKQRQRREQRALAEGEQQALAAAKRCVAQVESARVEQAAGQLRVGKPAAGLSLSLPLPFA